MKWNSTLLKIILLLGAIHSIFYSKAMHSIGTEITYKATNVPGIYEITLVIYRNCGDVALCSGTCGAACTQTLSIRGADSGYTNSAFGNISLSLQNVRDISNNLNKCASAKSICNNMGCVTPGTFTPGIERYEFKGFANLSPTSGIPAACCNVRIQAASCCRNALNTIDVGETYYLDVIINRCLNNTLTNSSPVFTNDPLFVACGGENIIYNNGIMDADNDSLFIDFYPTQRDYNTPVIYNSPFSYDKPMPWSGSPDSEFPGGISCNTKTGDVKFTPGNSGGVNFLGVLTFKCEEWRKINGVYKLLGTIRRECPMTILANCAPNNVPRLLTQPSNSSNPFIPQTYYETIAGKQLCFSILAKDIDYFPSLMSDTTNLTWNATLQKYGASFTPSYSGDRKITGPREDSYQFCWTPHDSVVSSIPYYFTVTAADSRCPLNGKTSSAFSIKVLSNPTVTLTQKQLECNTLKLSFIKSNTTAPDIFRWFVAKDTNDISFQAGYTSYFTLPSQTFSNTFSKPGKYYFKLIYGEVVLLTDSVIVPPFDLQHIVTTKNVSCYGANDGMINITPVNGIPPYLFKIKESSPFSPSSSFSQLTAGSYTISVKDSMGCLSSDSVYLQEPSALKLLKSFTQNTCDTFGVLTLNAVEGIKPLQFSINNSAFQSASTFTIFQSGKHILQVKDSTNCLQSDSILISLPQPFTLAYTKREISCYNTKDGMITLTGAGGYATGSYRYKNLTSGETNLNGIFNQLDSGRYQFSCKDDSNCVVTLSETWIQPAKIDIQILGNEQVNQPQIEAYQVAGSLPFKYKWSVINGTILSGQGTSMISVNWENIGIGLVDVEVTNLSNCSEIAEKHVTIGTTALNELSEELGLHIFPNPAHDILTISLKRAPEQTQLYLYDLQGKILLQQEAKVLQQLILSELPKGVYILRIGNDYRKVFKQ